MVAFQPMESPSPLRIWLRGFALAAALAATRGVLAETWVLPAAADARILRIGPDPGYQNANYQQDMLSVYHVGDNQQRTLLRFDLSPVVLPPGQRLVSAQLRLVASTGFGGNPEGRPMEVWRVTRPWTESQVTWLHASAGSPWETPGGEFSGLGERPFSTNTSQPANSAPVVWDVTELVDQWLEGVQPNHGMLLKSPAPNGLTFIQREFGGGGGSPDRPQLLLESGPGVPRLLAHLDAATGETVLSWRGVGTAVLQHRSALQSGADWTDVGTPVGVEGTRSVVRVAPADDVRLFRLRTP